ncbi:hypothetical protein GGTG_12500 [Gaeumannomyces tritici R3-111a-1]|uniref:Uncharacterized protein n=1 Tax=Gaeumannomyces tritici (strain R3-111a-1) TaxID=644352 RepID=J3PG74_GAET3|nr:hypothetical protein GGTG_12500 [Gaeumannomyces tritici R3-111a-1]EJT69614.1 hypothetical protein GGTG_12500 [Gaeumannomyces tritici R3-111a-1]
MDLQPSCLVDGNRRRLRCKVSLRTIYASPRFSFGKALFFNVNVMRHLLNGLTPGDSPRLVSLPKQGHEPCANAESAASGWHA